MKIAKFRNLPKLFHFWTLVLGPTQQASNWPTDDWPPKKRAAQNSMHPRLTQPNTAAAPPITSDTLKSAVPQRPKSPNPHHRVRGNPCYRPRFVSRLTQEPQILPLKFQFHHKSLEPKPPSLHVLEFKFIYYYNCSFYFCNYDFDFILILQLL